MGTLIAGIITLGLFGYFSIKPRLTQNQALSDYQKENEGQNHSYSDDIVFLRKKHFSVVYDNWFYGDKSFYPPEYIEFFKIDTISLCDYMNYLSNKMDWEVGICLKPKSFFTIKENQFSPNGKYGLRLEHFNKTGTLIPY